MAVNYLCQADVLKRKNWNLRRVRQYLDPIDRTAPNPKHRNYPWMKMHDMERVNVIMKSEQIKLAKAKLELKRRK